MCQRTCATCSSTSGDTPRTRSSSSRRSSVSYPTTSRRSARWTRSSRCRGPTARRTTSACRFSTSRRRRSPMRPCSNCSCVQSPKSSTATWLSEASKMPPRIPRRSIGGSNPSRTCTDRSRRPRSITEKLCRILISSWRNGSPSSRSCSRRRLYLMKIWKSLWPNSRRSPAACSTCRCMTRSWSRCTCSSPSIWSSRRTCTSSSRCRRTGRRS
mmetsp:Transcript_3967/g.11231  ORF Transcript_3967/g.11231 Transcript_3967/m.11231 type:complete len:213 (+) Transcript_3967:799-1437(+)